ncbi:unnamed protein product [Heligmosomoides polygyrus]|uniref:Uncharacterized protein n=1 Tax=Heligmosomoides polygyrus TaxID=6339 RepID=A0A183FNS1_HELPZ|nr:unnamed protein product [Heligmosomoides polygyrus]
MSTVAAVKTQIAKAANALKTSMDNIDRSFLEPLPDAGSSGANFMEMIQCLKHRWERAEEYATERSVPTSPTCSVTSVLIGTPMGAMKPSGRTKSSRRRYRQLSYCFHRQFPMSFHLFKPKVK